MISRPFRIWALEHKSRFSAILLSSLGPALHRETLAALGTVPRGGSEIVPAFWAKALVLSLLIPANPP